MKKYKLNENLLTIIENGKESVIDLDRLFPSPNIKYNDGTKTPQNEYVNRPSPLEAFYELGDNTPITDKWKIVETALNDNHFYLYIIDKICKYLGIDINSHRDLIETENEILNTLVENEKKLKALEIIKEKGLHYLEIALIKSSNRYEDYVDEMKITVGIRPMIDGKIKTKEEYDLLKEALL